MKGRVVGCRSEVERGNCLRCHGYSYFLCADDGLVETIFLVHIRLGMNWDLWLGWAGQNGWIATKRLLAWAA